MRVRPDFTRERELWSRGAATMVLAPDAALDGLADSKLLSPRRREALFDAIKARAVAIGIGRAKVEEVDRLNVYWAAMEARRRAVKALPITPDHVLVDGQRRIAGCHVLQTPVVDGDALSGSIAAASIVAKVTHDRLMKEHARLHPGYGFEHHNGYCTAVHLAALERLGALPLHRRSFAPVRVTESTRRQLPLDFETALWRLL
ncbi:MAG: ribonuclease HII [Candidatus Binataceae bacterium]